MNYPLFRGFFYYYMIFIKKEYMKNFIRNRLTENLTKGEVNDMLDTFINSNDFKKKIETIIKDRVKNEKMLEDKVVEITKNVLTQLYKTLWTKRNFWKTTLSNKTS